MAEGDHSGARSSGSASDGATVGARRYVGALQRNRLLIGLIVVVITGAVLVLSLVLPKHYKATARIVLNTDTGLVTSPDAAATERQLATVQELLTTPDVEAAAADKLGGGVAASSIDSKIDASVDQSANLVNVTATDDDPDQAAAIANAVAESFLDVDQQLEAKRIDATIAGIEQAIGNLQGTPGAGDQIAALQERLSELQAQKTVPELQLAERAEVPSNASSPKPLRNAILALLASLVIAILVALVRDRLRPRVSNPREISRILGANVLAGIPYVGRGLRGSREVMTAIEHESYETLRAAIQLAQPAGRQRVILITSAVHAEGKTTVTARLGRHLAEAGHRTLIVSADLRWPGIHELFGLAQRPGLSDVLQLIERAGVSEQLLPATAHAVPVRGSSGQSSNLHVLTSGTLVPDPARVLSGEAARKFFRYVRGYEYDYILVDAPPVIGIADVQGMIPLIDRVLAVARLDRLTVDKLVETGEVFDRSNADLLGVVVIGARVDVSPYYMSERAPTFTPQAPGSTAFPTGSPE